MARAPKLPVIDHVWVDRVRRLVLEVLASDEGRAAIAQAMARTIGQAGYTDIAATPLKESDRPSEPQTS